MRAAEKASAHLEGELNDETEENWLKDMGGWLEIGAELLFVHFFQAACVKSCTSGDGSSKRAEFVLRCPSIGPQKESLDRTFAPEEPAKKHPAIAGRM